MLNALMFMIAIASTAWLIAHIENQSPAMKQCQETHSYNTCFNSIYR